MNRLLLIFILAFVACKSPIYKKSKSKLTELANFKAKIDSVVNEELDANEPGFALLISYDGEMLIGKGYGVRDIDSQKKITKSTNIELASVSKQFRALAVLSLVDKGQISLTDTVLSSSLIKPLKTLLFNS